MLWVVPARRGGLSAALVALLALTVSCDDEPRRLPLDVAVIRVGGKNVRVEIARSADEQARGLMFRRSLGRNEGMIFVYGEPRIMSFWMKNTRIPLDIAFIDGKGRIIQIESMDPFDTISRHVSRAPATYALEMNRGWFARNGVKVGDRVEVETISNIQ